MHIDRHYDMLECFYDEDLQPLRDNPHMSYDEFKRLKRTKDVGEKYPVFRWDNYIMATYVLQPDWFHTNIFLTHKERDIGSSVFALCYSRLVSYILGIIYTQNSN